MGAEGLRRQRNFTRHITRRGEDTLVGGEIVTALWQDAETNRVHTFLAEDEWSKSSFEVRFTGDMLDKIRNAQEIVRLGPGWRTVVRQVTFEATEGVCNQVNALTVLAAD